MLSLSLPHAKLTWAHNLRAVLKHTDSDTHRETDMHTAVTGKDTHMQKSRGILRRPYTQTPRDTRRYTQTQGIYRHTHLDSYVSQAH